MRREADGRYVCPECEYEWTVEGRFDGDGDFEPFDEDNTNCPNCDSVGEYTSE